jgi:hypothetical protein
VSGKTLKQNDISRSREKVSSLWRSDQLSRLGSRSNAIAERRLTEGQYCYSTHTTGFAEFEENRRRVAGRGKIFKAAARLVTGGSKVKLLNALKVTLLFMSDVMLLVVNLWLIVILAALFSSWGQV